MTSTEPIQATVKPPKEKPTPEVLELASELREGTNLWLIRDPKGNTVAHMSKAVGESPWWTVVRHHDFRHFTAKGQTEAFTMACEQWNSIDPLSAPAKVIK